MNKVVTGIGIGLLAAWMTACASFGSAVKHDQQQSMQDQVQSMQKSVDQAQRNLELAKKVVDLRNNLGIIVKNYEYLRGQANHAVKQECPLFVLASKGNKYGHGGNSYIVDDVNFTGNQIGLLQNAFYKLDANFPEGSQNKFYSSDAVKKIEKFQENLEAFRREVAQSSMTAQAPSEPNP